MFFFFRSPAFSPQCQDCEESAVQCTRCPGDSYLNVDTQTCQDSCNYFVSRVTANVRLVGGGGPLEGRVEVSIFLKKPILN